jgi:hypothetical protein
MRCLVCAAEMYVTQVVEDGTMPVPGFEHHTLECLECGAIERRLLLTREKTQPISPSDRRKIERIVKPRTPMEAFEKVRRRDATLAAERAADKAVKAAVATVEEIAETFRRKWENLASAFEKPPGHAGSLRMENRNPNAGVRNRPASPTQSARNWSGSQAPASAITQGPQKITEVDCGQTTSDGLRQQARRALLSVLRQLEVDGPAPVREQRDPQSHC